MTARQQCAIADVATVAGTLTVTPSPASFHVQATDGSWAALASTVAKLSLTTTAGGKWAIALPSRDDCVPGVVRWTIALPNGDVYAGRVTRAMVQASQVTPLSLDDLAGMYGWSSNSGSVVTALTPTYASTIALDPTAGNTFIITTTSGVGNATLNLSSSPRSGQPITLIINNDSGGARTITFGTNFRMTASTIIGTASKVMVVQCVSDGTNAIELSRTVAIT